MENSANVIVDVVVVVIVIVVVDSFQAIFWSGKTGQKTVYDPLP